ncbi:MAG: aryl-sulfate sulfotransferase [Defluviitaleaceae bacterium]|nr:aryl-sulfate sulfotransferase [Defluviitaleaceae bacterium]
MGHPSIYPTGTTIYQKEKANSGYTVFPSAKGALLIDMNGNEVNLWAGLSGFPNKILPGGHVLGSTGIRTGERAYQDQLDLVQVDWDGNVVWQFNRSELVADEGKEPTYQARQHHDYQREGSAVGYYSPFEQPLVDKGNTLLLIHENVKNPQISDKLLLDDKIIEVTWDGEIVWQWRASDHFDAFGFDETAKNVLFRDPSVKKQAGGDWLHINSMSTLGPNKWYDEGDERFHPDNIIFDSRQANILAIISKQTGDIVWRVGPDFNENEATRKLGWMIGVHHLHMIPKGLPGEGDLLIFDNGGAAGYGATNPASTYGINHALRDYSRVIQFNPITLEMTWQYTPAEAGYQMMADGSRFYSPYVSAAQRLPNGNTLITEGSDGRLIEVTPDHEIVWEYINPYFSKVGKGEQGFTLNMVYRAYRVPYDWIPQLEKPEEVAIEPIDVSTFRVPGAAVGHGGQKVTYIEGVTPKTNMVTGWDSESEDENAADFCMVSFKD